MYALPVFGEYTRREPHRYRDFIFIVERVWQWMRPHKLWRRIGRFETRSLATQELIKYVDQTYPLRDSLKEIGGSMVFDLAPLEYVERYGAVTIQFIECYWSTEQLCLLYRTVLT
jgi:hypothetical protein